MSRHYGRRQKRAAREREEMLQLSLESAMIGRTSHRIALRTAQDRFDGLKQRIMEWDSDIRSMLGPYTSFAIDDTTFRVDHPDQIRQMKIMPRLPVLGIMSDREVEESVSFYVERVLHLLTTFEEEDLMTLRRYLSLRLMVGSDWEGYSVYGMSESYWQHLQRTDGPGRARVVRRLAEDLFRVLIEGEKKKKAAAKPKPAYDERWVDLA